MTSSNCSTIRRLISIINSGDKTSFISRLNNLDLCRYGRVFQQDQIKPIVSSPVDNTETEAEETFFVDMTIMCKQCDEAFTVTCDEQSSFAKKTNIVQPERVPAVAMVKVLRYAWWRYSQRQHRI